MATMLELPKQGHIPAGLEERIAEFRKMLAAGMMTAERKILDAQKLLHDLRADYKGPRTITPERSRRHRKFLRFVIKHNREATAARAGGRR